MSDEGFLSRWARRKAQVQEGKPVADEPLAAPDDAVATTGAAGSVAPRRVGAESTAGEPGTAGKPGSADRAGSADIARRPKDAPMAGNGAAPNPAPPLPTMDDVAQLTRASDYSRFVAPGVDRSVSNAAMKKLFSDPHFNVMDGLDVYIDDYGKPDPIPDSMLRRMTQSKMLGLFDETPAADATSDVADATTPAVPPTAAETPPAATGADVDENAGATPTVEVAAAPPDGISPLATPDGAAAPRLSQSEAARDGGQPEDLLP